MSSEYLGALFSIVQPTIKSFSIFRELYVNLPAGPGLDFSGQSLKGRNFARENLLRSNFSTAKLKGVIFDSAHLDATNFTEVKHLSSSALAKGQFQFLFAKDDKTGKKIDKAVRIKLQAMKEQSKDIDLKIEEKSRKLFFLNRARECQETGKDYIEKVGDVAFYKEFVSRRFNGKIK